MKTVSDANNSLVVTKKIWGRQSPGYYIRPPLPFIGAGIIKMSCIALKYFRVIFQMPTQVTNALCHIAVPIQCCDSHSKFAKFNFAIVSRWWWWYGIHSYFLIHFVPTVRYFGLGFSTKNTCPPVAPVSSSICPVPSSSVHWHSSWSNSTRFLTEIGTLFLVRTRVLSHCMPSAWSQQVFLLTKEQRM